MYFLTPTFLGVISQPQPLGVENKISYLAVSQAQPPYQPLSVLSDSWMCSCFGDSFVKNGLKICLIICDKIATIHASLRFGQLTIT